MPLIVLGAQGQTTRTGDSARQSIGSEGLHGPQTESPALDGGELAQRSRDTCLGPPLVIAEPGLATIFRLLVSRVFCWVLSQRDCSDPGYSFPNTSLIPFLCPPTACSVRAGHWPLWVPLSDSWRPWGHSLSCRKALISLEHVDYYWGHCSPPGFRAVPPPFFSQMPGSLGALLGGFCSLPTNYTSER